MGYCHDCQLNRGAVPPEWNPTMAGNTCRIGNCEGCDKKDCALCYDVDYDWPDGRKAIFD